MDYKDDDIEFANRLLARREELNDEEVTAWLKEKDHVELLDEIAAIRQKLSRQSYGESGEEEFLYLEKSIYDRKSRRMTLRWSIAASIILLVGLFVGRTISGVRDIHEEQELAKSVMQPGTSKAILMMADGKEVVLEQGQNLNILLNERVRVATSSQGIVYEEHGKGMVTEEYNKLTTPVGGEYSLVLSDGTKVFLNAESEMNYPVVFAGGERKVVLKGEAFFEVAEDKARPFVVSTGDFDVRVTGTQFNVRVYPDETPTATLAEGSIRLLKGEHITDLVPGEQARVGAESVEVRKVNLEEAIAWRHDAFSFKQVRLEDLLTELARWYDMEVFYQNTGLKDLHFTAWFKRSSSMKEVVRLLERTQKVKLEVKGKTLIVKPNK